MAAVAGVLSLATFAAHAADKSWSTGPGDGNFGGTNWTAGQVPGAAATTVATTDALFFGTSTVTTLNNDLSSHAFNGLTFLAGGSAYTIGGNAFTLGGNLVNNSGVVQTINNNVALGGNFALTAGSATLNGAVTGAQSFGNTGAGTLTATNGAWSGVTYMNNAAGTFTISATSAMVGGIFHDKGTMNLSGTLGTSAAVNNFVIGTGVGAGRATLNTSANATRGNMFVGDNGANGGAVYQTGGTITLTQAAGIDNLRVGSNANGAGYYDLSGGSLVANRPAIGASLGNTIGVMDVRGGVLTANERIEVAAGSGTSSGLLNVTGGSVTAGTDIRIFTLAGGSTANAAQRAVLNVGGGAGLATVTTGNLGTVGVNMAQSGNIVGMQSVVNLLTNGTLTTGRILGTQANVTTHFNFNGGTLKVTATNAGTIFNDTGVDQVNVYAGGGTIDNSGTNIIIDEVLRAPAGSGANSNPMVTAGGSGYIGAPIVAVSGTGGAGATAYATVSGGQVTGIVVTSPGTGYTGPLSFTLSGGGGTGATIGTVTQTANVGGGMTFKGAGTTTLSATNTFTGDLTIDGGTVAAGSGQGAAPTASNLGALQPAANRNITVNNGGTLSLTGGNVLGTGGSTNTLSNTTLVVNSGGLVRTGLDGPAVGWWNKVGATNLNGGVIRVGSGANNTNFQGLALIGTVTVGGSSASSIENFAASDSTSNGVHLGQNATAGQSITFDVADVAAGSDLNVSVKLLNTSANLTASGLTKTGAGSMTLTGANTYSGGTIINSGTVYANNAAGSAAGAGGVAVNSGGTLAGTGSVSGAVTVAGGGALAPGASIESLNTGALVFDAGSTLVYEFDSATVTADLLNSSGTLTLAAGALASFDDIAVTDVPMTPGIKFTLIRYDGATDPLGVNPLTNAADMAVLTNLSTFSVGANSFLINYFDTSAGSNYANETSAGLFVTLTSVAAVPEASAFLYGGLVTCGLYAWKRRKSRGQGESPC